MITAPITDKVMMFATIIANESTRTPYMSQSINAKDTTANVVREIPS